MTMSGHKFDILITTFLLINMFYAAHGLYCVIMKPVLLVQDNEDSP